jgi:L-aminopeptidase/D-esterase-like protein
MAGDLTDVPGIRVGHWTDTDGATGCTVVLLPDAGAVASVDVRGAAPGTRETDVLHPDNQVQVAHAILLAGGSAFGLAGPGTVGRLLASGVPAPPPIGTNTTLVVVATDVALTKVQAHRMAVTAHDGLALAIRPVHTAYDGDTVFVASTGAVETGDASMLLLQTAAVEVVAEAIRSAVRS